MGNRDGNRLMPIIQRKERLVKAEQIIFKMIPNEYSLIQSTISLALGITLEKAREYIKVIVDVRGLVIFNGKVEERGQE